jgi:hypothetical protein
LVYYYKIITGSDVEDKTVAANEGQLMLDGGFVMPHANSFGHTFRFNSSLHNLFIHHCLCYACQTPIYTIISFMLILFFVFLIKSVKFFLFWQIKFFHLDGQILSFYVLAHLYYLEIITPIFLSSYPKLPIFFLLFGSVFPKKITDLG